MKSTRYQNRAGLCVRLLLAIAFTASIKVDATDFYVDTSHPSASDSNPGTPTSPWKSISKANSTMVAGDRVYIKAGNYNQTISPANSGTASQRITYQNYAGDLVTISEASMGVQMAGKNFITVSGLSFANNDGFYQLLHCTNNIITNCVFKYTRNFNQWGGGVMEESSQSNKVVNCWLEKWGNQNGDDNGSLLDFGDEGDPSDFTRYNIVEGCILMHGGHDVINLRSGYNVIRGNYIRNDPWTSGYGNRGIVSFTTPGLNGRNLIESNRVAWASPSVDSTTANSGINLRTGNNIVRRNMFYENSDAGVMMDAGSNWSEGVNNTVYHNVFYRNGLKDARNAHIGLWNWGSGFIIANNAIVNNIFRSAVNTIYVSGASLSDQTVAGNSDQSTDPLFVDISSYVASDTSKPNFSLRNGSPCIDAGTWLTTITSPNGSGTSFVVRNARFFQDGWAGITPDRIQLQGQSSSVAITRIDYVTQTITVASTLTWTTGQGVALPYNGSAPDQGAFESGSGSSAPLITSSPNASGNQGLPFNYQITAANGPTSFGATSLPAGLSLATSSGAITGVPSTSGTFVCTISASNPFGTGSATLTITIAPPSPIIGVSAGSLTFAEIGTGQTEDLQVLVTNRAVGTLTGTASAAAPFSVVSGASYALTAGQVWPVTVRYAPTSKGTHSGSVTFTGGGGATVQLAGQAFPVFAGWTFASTNGLVTAPFTIDTGYLVQGIETDGNPTTTGSGRAVYGFTILNAGNYVVSAYADAPDGGRDSIYLNVDAEPADPTMIWDIPLTVGFERRTASWRGSGTVGAAEFAPRVFVLSAGVHKLILRGREPGVRLGLIDIAAAGGAAKPTPPANLRIVTGN